MSKIAMSIVVPCYKVEQYLPRCIDSLVCQTLENIELIFINDGSPDKCIDILKDYKLMYPDKIVIIDKDNEGVWAGRWDAIKIARGDYIGFLDSDDYARPTFAEELYTAAVKSDADISVCGFDRVDLKTGKVLSREMVSARPAFRISDYPGRLVELNGAPWNKCFRASVLKKLVDLSDPPQVLDDLCFHLIAYNKMSGSVVFVPSSLVCYMVREGSIINSVKTSQIDSILTSFIEIKERYLLDSPSLIESLDAIAFLHLGISFAFRIATSPEANKLKDYICRITDYLDCNFPSWRKSPYINYRYAIRYRGVFLKLLVVQCLFKAGFISVFFKLYQLMIEKCHIDIKW